MHTNSFLLKRLVRTQDAGARSVFYDYDANSNRVSLRDSRGQLTAWRYDGSDRVLRKVYADGRYDAYAYQSGRLSQRRDARGQITNYGYDSYDRLSLVDYPNDADVTMGYDALNRVTSMQDGLGTSTFAYDPIGNLTQADGPWADDALTYNYDTLNRRDGLSIASGVGAFNVGYGYDVLGRLQNVSSPAGNFGHGYVGATGLLQSVSLPNGTGTSYGYDAFQRLTQMQSRDSAGGNISSYSYGYDTTTHRPGRTGEVSQVLGEAAITRAYAYDGVDQLEGESVSQGGASLGSSGFVYDAMGNRTQSTSTSAAGTSTTSYGTNKLNQVGSQSTTSGTTTSASALGYDESGNLKQVSSGGSNTLYGYDDSNQLTSVEVPSQTKSLFVYDGARRLRISRDFAWQNGAWVQTSEVRRLYDELSVVQERDAQNQVLATYTRGKDLGGGIGGILSRTDQNGSLFYHYDGRGDVTELSDAQGQVQARYAYDAFGNTTATGPAASLNRFRFSTKEQIGSLYSYGYRFYSPGLGRWINRDSIREVGGLNLYGFVGNSPTNLVDADGRIALALPLLGAAAGGGSAAAVGAVAVGVVTAPVTTVVVATGGWASTPATIWATKSRIISIRLTTCRGFQRLPSTLLMLMKTSYRPREISRLFHARSGAAMIGSGTPKTRGSLIKMETFGYGIKVQTQIIPIGT